MMRNCLLGSFLASTLTILGVGVAAAQVPYDPPTLSLVDRGMYRFTLSVTAGASGAPAGFRIQWMKRADYDLYGWPADGHPSLIYCDFYDTPTLNLWAGSPILGPNQTAYAQPGDLYDETHIYTNYNYELAAGTEYAIRGRVEGDGNGDPSAYSATLFGTTLPECTQGFWKNHPEVWPKSCTPMMLGTVEYTKDELLKIFNTPASGNGLISLAHQLIAAKLNVCNGSTPPAAVTQAIADADALIDGLVVPTVGAGSLAPSETSDLTELLDDYNNGLFGGVANCPTGVITNTTWGRLKVLYR